MAERMKGFYMGDCREDIGGSDTGRLLTAKDGTRGAGSSHNRCSREAVKALPDSISIVSKCLLADAVGFSGCVVVSLKRCSRWHPKEKEDAVVRRGVRYLSFSRSC